MIIAFPCYCNCRFLCYITFPAPFGCLKSFLKYTRARPHARARAHTRTRTDARTHGRACKHARVRLRARARTCVCACGSSVRACVRAHVPTCWAFQPTMAHKAFSPMPLQDPRVPKRHIRKSNGARAPSQGLPREEEVRSERKRLFLFYRYVVARAHARAYARARVCVRMCARMHARAHARTHGGSTRTYASTRTRARARKCMRACFHVCPCVRASVRVRMWARARVWTCAQNL